MTPADASSQDQNPPPAAPCPSHQKSKRLGCITAGSCVADIWQKQFRRRGCHESNLNSSHIASPCVVLCGRKRTIKAMWLTRLIYGQRKFRHSIIWREDVLCRFHAGHYEYEPTLSDGSQIGCTVLSSRMGNFKQLRGKNSSQTFT